jgi:hypothetical protein
LGILAQTGESMSELPLDDSHRRQLSGKAPTDVGGSKELANPKEVLVAGEVT